MRYWTCLRVLLVFGCADDSGKQVDAGTDALLADTRAPADEPFGRICDTVGQQCKDKDPRGYTLWCIALKGSTAGKGFCTPQCTDIGGECQDAPNGQWSSCFIESESQGDAGPGAKYCGFLCKQEKKTWDCPGTLGCGEVNSQGTAVCLP